MRLLAIGGLLFLVGCKKDVDADHDGVRAEVDCDDEDPNVFPGNDEVCNGLDENCDQQVDEGVTIVFYPDADSDGAGDADATPVTGCETPQGFSEDNLDCDDSRSDIHIGATEDCSTDDLDCDGDPVNGLETDTFYVDADGDTFGDADVPTVQACGADPGLSEIGGDCDDTTAAISPVAVEICDGIDQDCDEDIDEDAIDQTAFYQDADLDGFGNPETEILGCDEIPGLTTDGTDCDDLDNTAFPGGPELCAEGDNDCDPLTADDQGIDTITFYTDFDQDTFGDTLAPIQSCEQGDAAILDGDCDDNAFSTNPGAIELCDGGIDNDCDPLTDEETTAIWYFDQDGDGFGIDTDTFLGCSPPPDYVQTDGDCDDTDPALNPDLTPECDQVHCGLISVSETWKNTVTHTVTCDVDVEGAAKPILTVDDGAVVRFNASTELRVGVGSEGELIVDGDVLGVVFTSSDPFPAPGDWDGLVLGDSDRGSDIVGLVVEYGGKNGEGGVTVDGGNPTFDRLTSRNNLNNGVHVTGSEPLIHDSALVENTNNGLFVDDAEGVGLSRVTALGDDGPSFTDNVVTDNDALPITIPGSHADEIALSSILSPNAVDEIELLSGTLRFTGTWFDHEIPYRVADSALIEVEDGPQAELTIEDGVEIFFGTSAELSIGEGAEGRLEMEDGAVGIVFNATADVISSSENWDGITFGADDGGSVVRNLTISYGGGNGNGNIDVISCSPLFDNVVSQLSDTAGMHVTGTVAAPEIINSAFLDNDEDGVFVESSSGLAHSLFGPTFVNNVLSGNGLSSITLPANAVGELDGSSLFAGNGLLIGIHGGDVVVDAVWQKLDEDFQVLGDVDIGGPTDPVVEIEDQALFLFDSATEFTAGVADDGALIISAGVGVTMTSSDPAPAEGDWKGIQIGRNGPFADQTFISGLTVEFAGGSDLTVGGSIDIIDRDACTTIEPLQTLERVTIIGSSKAGVFAEPSATISLTDVTIAGALDGCFKLAEAGNCFVTIAAFDNVDCQAGGSFGTFPIMSAGQLDTGSSFPGPVILSGDLVDDDLTINDIGVPYQLFDVVVVADAVADPVLTVSAGVELQFGAGAGIEVARNDPGALVIQAGALLTSTEAAPSAGDWDGVTVGDECLTTTSLVGATIEYGGANGDAALYVDDCELGTYSAMSITDSSSCGVLLEPFDSLLIPQFGGFTFSGNALGDLCF